MITILTPNYINTWRKLPFLRSPQCINITQQVDIKLVETIVHKRYIHHPFFEPSVSKEAPLYVGIIGAGSNCKQKHIPNLTQIKGVEIVAVSNRTRQSADAVAKQFNIPKVYSHWQEIINDKKIDAIVVGTWPYMHKAMTVSALEAGKHVLCEARMAMNAKEAHEMLEVAKKKSDLVAQLVPAPYTLKYDQTIRNLLQTNFVGDLIAADFRSLDGSFVDITSDLHWRQDIDKSGLSIQYSL